MLCHNFFTNEYKHHCVRIVIAQKTAFIFCMTYTVIFRINNNNSNNKTMRL